jgi:hypothetical protein
MIGQIWAAQCPISARKSAEWLPILATSNVMEVSVPYSYREAALNWLALGLLLAAWNASDDTGATRDAMQGSRDALNGNALNGNALNGTGNASKGSSGASNGTRDVPPRPAALRGYSLVSVRAATRAAVIKGGFTAR